MTDLLSTISEISAFKRREHEFEYDMEKKIAQRKSEPHHVYINGKVWKKQGQPVEFNSHAHATAAGQSVLKRDPSKHVSVAHYSYFDKHGGTDHTYARTTKEEVDADVQESFHDDFLKMVQKTHPSARLTTGAEKKKEGEELMKKRVASGVKPVYPRPEKTYPLGGYDPVSHRSYSEEVELKEAAGLSIKTTDDLHTVVNSKGRVIVQFPNTPKGLLYAQQFIKQNKGIKELEEAVSVHHDRYLRSHGKKASGHGMWMFTHKRFGDADLGDDKEVHQARGTFSDAAKSAQKWAKSQGHSAVYVMEDAQLDEANDDILDVKSTYQKIAIKHLKDSSRKDATPAQKMYAAKMMKRALESSKMDDHTAALNHYRGMSEGVGDVSLDEVLTKSDPASTWIRDFIKSKSSRLAGDTKKQRIKRALGAYYAKQQENLDAAYTTINVGK